MKFLLSLIFIRELIDFKTKGRQINRLILYLQMYVWYKSLLWKNFRGASEEASMPNTREKRVHWPVASTLTVNFRSPEGTGPPEPAVPIYYIIMLGEWTRRLVYNPENGPKLRGLCMTHVRPEKNENARRRRVFNSEVDKILGRNKLKIVDINYHREIYRL